MNIRYYGWAGIMLASLPAIAHAQSSVTLYGVADVSIRYLSAATATGGSQWSLTNGAISQSRWGLAGREDLGGDLAAIFRLESGFSIPTGAPSSSGVLFNRFAYVGLASQTYGTITAGQQNNPVYQHLIEGWDPLTVGNYKQNAWLPLAFSGFLHGENNTVTYRYLRGALSASAAYGFGNLAGNFSGSSMKGVSVAYDPSPLGAEAGYTETYSAAGFKQTAYNVQLRYRAGAPEFWLGYYHSTDETGAVDAFLNGNTAISSSSNPRKDNAFVAGAAYQFTPFLRWTNAFYYDTASNILSEAGSAGNGKRYAVVTLVDYALSKRTTIYATADFNRVTGAAASELANRTYQIGVGTGLRVRF